MMPFGVRAVPVRERMQTIGALRGHLAAFVPRLRTSSIA